MPVPPARPVPPAYRTPDTPTYRETVRTVRPVPGRRGGALLQTWGLGLAAVALTVGFLLAVSDLVSRLG